jgi:hypothetical protein
MTKDPAASPPTRTGSNDQLPTIESDLHAPFSWTLSAAIEPVIGHQRDLTAAGVDCYAVSARCW